jgi:FkbM family methyltransferase
VPPAPQSFVKECGNSSHIRPRSAAALCAGDIMNRLKLITVELLGRILPDRVKDSIFHLSFHLAQGEFERYSYDYNFAPNMKFGLAAMARRGFVPNTIVDVGAFQGDWSRAVRRIWPTSQLIMIEPNLENRTLLAEVAKALDARLICELLGSENNQAVQFYVMGSGSSIMNERSAVQRTVETRYLRTLDSLLGEVKSPSLLKIDAQGYELQIIKGAFNIISAFEAVLLEIAVIEINEGAPLLHEVVAFMKELGFVTYDIFEIHRRPLDGALNQVDVMFVRELSKLIADKRHFA